jgi:N-acylneuraminate cytidylyltransferase
MNVLGLIPARGGSKGLPHKNRLEAGGIPLLAWTIRVACQCPRITRLVLSSDDPELAAIARAEGCEVPFLRPAEHASDTAGSAEVVLHALEELGADWDAVVLLQPTSPLRQLGDLEAALDLFAAAASSVVSVVEVPAPLPSQYLLQPDRTLKRAHPDVAPVSRRQDAQLVLTPNGAIYVVEPHAFQRQKTFVDPSTRALVMPRERSLDIDTASDLAFLRYLCSQNPALVPPPSSIG